MVDVIYTAEYMLMENDACGLLFKLLFGKCYEYFELQEFYMILNEKKKKNHRQK